jgi:hypothetical protein
VRKEHAMSTTKAPASAAPHPDPARLAQARRMKALSPSERLGLMDRLCRELTTLATTATRRR